MVQVVSIISSPVIIHFSSVIIHVFAPHGVLGFENFSWCENKFIL
jgi:hypothetical protein